MVLGIANLAMATCEILARPSSSESAARPEQRGEGSCRHGPFRKWLQWAIGIFPTGKFARPFYAAWAVSRLSRTAGYVFRICSTPALRRQLQGSYVQGETSRNPSPTERNVANGSVARWNASFCRIKKIIFARDRQNAARLFAVLVLSRRRTYHLQTRASAAYRWCAKSTGRRFGKGNWQLPASSRRARLIR